MTEYEKMNKNFPFLTVGMYADEEIVGIVRNSDEKIIAVYVYDDIPTVALKQQFMEYGEIWWIESNRKIPINMFIGSDFKIFAPYCKTFTIKEFKYIGGPLVCIDDMMAKRVKRRSIQLVRKVI